jgi:SAM-dependent methyltransferase
VPLKLLDNPVLWETSRVALDLTFGLYRRRIALMRRWRILDGDPSILDIGCGIGQYAGVTRGDYLGVDLNDRYLDWARRRRGGSSRAFRSVDVRELAAEGRRFDLVLMVDFLHHLADDACIDVLESARALAGSHVVSFEPVTVQPRALGRWIVENDRGDHVRSLSRLEELLGRAGLDPSRNEALQLGPINTRAILCPGGRDRPRDAHPVTAPE